MPAWPIFAAAAQIGEHIGIAFFDPEQAKRPGAIGLAGQISRGLRRLEPAIAVDQRRHRAFRGLVAHQEIGDARAVLRRGEALLHAELARVERRRQALHKLRLLGRRDRVERWRRQHPLDGYEGEVGRPRRLHKLHGVVAGKRNRRRRPAAIRPALQRQQLAGDIVQHLHPQHRVGRRNLLDRLFVGRRHHQLRQRGRVGQRPGDQRALREALAAHRQRAVQQRDEAPAQHILVVGIVRHRQLQRLAVAQQIGVTRPEAFAAHNEREALAAVSHGEWPGRNVALLARHHGRCIGERAAALPQLDDARVA